MADNVLTENYLWEPQAAQPRGTFIPTGTPSTAKESLEDYTRRAYPGKILGSGRFINLKYEACSPYVSSLMAQRRELGELKDQFYGPETTYIRWLIENKQREISTKIEEFYGRQGFSQKPAPVPEWLSQYMEPSIPLQKSGYPYTDEAVEDERGRRREEEKPKAASLIPLGAQAELSPEQLGLMAGYTAWGKAGSPTRYSERAIRDMADWQRWWEPYTRLSESLFPKSRKLGARWMPARQ